MALETEEKKYYPTILPEGAEGYVAISEGDSMYETLQIKNTLTSSSQNNLYVIEQNQENIKYWLNQNIKGLIIEMEQIPKVKAKWTQNQKS